MDTITGNLPTQTELDQQLFQIIENTQESASIDVTTLESLITAGANINAANMYGDNALMWAASRGNIAMITALLVIPGIDVNLANQWTGETALMLATEKNGDAVTALLASLEINVNLKNSNGNTALILAVSHGNIAIVSALLEDPGILVNLKNKEGNTALMEAIRQENTDMVTTLLTAPGIDVTIENHWGTAALMSAAIKGCTAIVTALLAAPGIQVNQANPQGTTPLMSAARESHTATITALLADPSIDVNLANQYGDTALIVASRYDYTTITTIVTALLATPGINVNLANRSGGTALMGAAGAGHTAVVTALLETPGIDINLENQYGNTAIVQAFENGHPDIVRLLQARGAVLPERLRRQENPVANNINRNQSVHEVSVHESVSNSAKNLREYYHYTQEEIIEQTKKLFDWLSADFSDTSILPQEYKPEWLAPARKCMVRLSMLEFTDQRSGVSMQEALAFVWAGINNIYANGTDKAGFSEAEITSRRINFLKNLNEIQREYNLGDGANPQDNGAEDSTTCVSGSFNKLIAALSEVGHIGVQVVFLTKDIINLQTMILTKQAFPNLSEENRTKFALGWDGENSEELQAECFGFHKKLVSTQLHEKYDEFHKEVPNLNEILTAAIENIKYIDMSAVIEKEKQAILKKEQAVQAERKRQHQAAELAVSPPPVCKRHRPEPVVFSCITRTGLKRTRAAEHVNQPEPEEAAVLSTPARRNPKRITGFTGSYKV